MHSPIFYKKLHMKYRFLNTAIYKGLIACI
nr:MAG TPA: hypothetical protein [Bacteriophage sp.]DAQ68259.1 MAG TPA: hypothetical protein [Bacteriophage sp.]